MKNVVLDSNTINDLLRPPPKGKMLTVLDQSIKAKRLKIRCDPAGGLISEWKNTCGDELIAQLQIHWEQWAGVESVTSLVAIPKHALKQLRQLGFGFDIIDRLILRIALATPCKIVISRDPDFWDPKVGSSAIGKSAAAVAAFLLSELSVDVHHLEALCTWCNGPAHAKQSKRKA